MNKNSLELYMGNIYDIPLITREDEAMLAARIAQGDEEARHKLIQSNLLAKSAFSIILRARFMPVFLCFIFRTTE